MVTEQIRPNVSGVNLLPTNDLLLSSGINLLCEKWLENHTILQTNSTESYAHSHRPPIYLVWILGLSFVTIVSLCALVGIIFMKMLKKNVFDNFITFFVSVGVGSLSGSAVFHLLPQAFGLVKEFDPNANYEYLTRAFAAISGIYIFFFSDKAIKIILETKKRNEIGTELNQIKQHKNCINNFDFDSKAEEIVTKKKSGTNVADNHSSRSSDALIFIEQNSKKAYNCNEFLAEKKFADDSEVPFNRQAHSICVHDHDMQYKEGDSVIATVAWMIIFGDGLHNFIDGISIGASFSESIFSGISVSLAVICEEFPHELGDVAILVSAGMTLRQALVYNLLSALTCYFGFVIGVMVGNLDDSFASYTFGFAGGMFLYISMSCMMPEMKNAMETALQSSFSEGIKVLILQASGVACGLITMIIMERYGGEISFRSFT